MPSLMSSIIELIHLKIRGRSHVSLRFVFFINMVDGTNASNKKKKSAIVNTHIQLYYFADLYHCGRKHTNSH